MAAEKPQQSLADYLAIAICPALIMALVGTLVFFLLEVLYSGQYGSRLGWILFLFVFAAVLIARISMQGGISERAPMYGIALAAVVWVALVRFVEYESDTTLAKWSWAINSFLMALIWWSAHRLTWDCTLIDDQVDASGSGLLQEAGLETQTDGSKVPDTAGSLPSSSYKIRRHGGANGLLAWWRRFEEFRERRRSQPHAPGVWIVYFSLAALPLFGLGQSLIPPGELNRRRYAFCLVAIYMGSGLGLLLTTSFLGLRRYLRQRKLQMPAAMTGVWLFTGLTLAMALLLAGAILPRPYPEYPLVNLSRIMGSSPQDASRFAVGKNSPGQKEGREMSPSRTGQDQKEDGKDGKSPSGPAGQDQSKQGSSQGGSQAGQNSAQNGQGKSQSGPDSHQSKQGESTQESNQGRGEHTSNEKSDRKNQQTTANQGDKQGGEKARTSHPKEDQQTSPVKPKGFSLTALFKNLATLLKWLLFAAIAFVVGFILLRAVLKVLANFTGWARNLLGFLEGFWARLFGWLPSNRPVSEVTDQAVEVAKRRPFASFQNPFKTGIENSISQEQLVRYSFEALEAWAAELSFGREAGETPIEFVQRVGDEIPALEADACRLGALYARIAYSRGKLPASGFAAVQDFWHTLEEVAERPMSA